MSDAGAHRERVADVFDRGASTYDAEGAALFPRFARRLVEAAGVAPGHAVLDVATGTGQVLLAAAQVTGPTGSVVGVDVSEGMLDQARAAIAAMGVSRAELRAMDAERLEFPDASFDRVLCGFGLFFLPDPVAVLRQFRRLLRPGGLAAATTFRPEPAMGWLRELFESCGVSPGGLAISPLNRPELVAAAFTEAGFARPQVVAEDASTVYPNEDAWYRFMWAGANRAVMEAMDEPARARFQAAAYAGLQAHRSAEGITIPRTVLIATARVGSADSPRHARR
jgi:ubiquinone/menaquinone biosynthesis C-methylase UbiE